VKLIYAPTFIRQYKKLPQALQEEIKEKIELFKEKQNHTFLKTHKLKGSLKNKWSFSVNYKYLIIFKHTQNQEIALLSVGDHEIYK